MATSSNVNARIARFLQTTERADEIVNGSDTTEVLTDGGLVPSFAKQLKDMETAFEGGVGGIFDTVVGGYANEAKAARDDSFEARDEAVATVPTHGATAPSDPIPGAQWTSDDGVRFEWMVIDGHGQWVEPGSTISIGNATGASAEAAAIVATQAKVDAQAAAATAVPAATTATTQAGISTVKASESAASAVVATSAKAAAESAAVAAAVSGNAKNSISEGRASVADGQAFIVRPNTGDGLKRFTVFLRTSSTTQTFVADSISGSEWDAVFDFLPGGDDFAAAFADPGGRASWLIEKDGTFTTGAIATGSLNGFTAAELQAGFSAVTALSTEMGPYPFSVSDSQGRSPAVSLEDGTIAFHSIETQYINGIAMGRYKPSSLYGGNFYAEIVYFNNTGQSLSEGSNNPPYTTAQEYDNMGFPARSTSPSAMVPLTVANTEVSGRGESPMYGALGHIKELILEEAGIGYADQSYQLVGCNNGYSGTPIANLKKGTAPYAAALTQVSAGLSIAQAAGKTFAAGAVFWTQGETDISTPFATYRDTQIQLATDFDADYRAITGQARAVPMICYQTASMTSKDVALAQLAASNTSPLIFMACPMYMLDYYDFQHINSRSSKLLGAYYGLVYKRVVIDGKDWKPVQPVSHVRQGAVLNVHFVTPVRPLVLDTAGVPAQSNYGFSLVDPAGNAIAISSVAVVGPDVLRIVASTSIAAGSKLRYGFNSAVGKSPFVGSAGNLRDSQGLQVVYAPFNYPMHNWGVIFEYTL